MIEAFLEPCRVRGSAGITIDVSAALKIAGPRLGLTCVVLHVARNLPAVHRITPQNLSVPRAYTTYLSKSNSVGYLISFLRQKTPMNGVPAVDNADNTWPHTCYLAW